MEFSDCRASRPDAENVSHRSRILLTLAHALIVAAVLSGCSVEARKARHLGKAENYFKAGNYEKAKIEYMLLLRLEPRNALAFQRLGFIWLEEGAPFRAAAFLLKAQELAPGDLNPKITLAKALFALGRLADARQQALAVLEQSPGQDDAIILLADTDQTKVDVDLTEQQLQKAPRPDNASFQLASGNVAAQRGDFASAETSIRQAMTLDPRSPLPHLAMANLNLFRKKVVEAGEELKAAAELSPARSSARLRYAEFKAQSGAGDEASAILREVTHQAPDYLPAWRLLSQIALDNKKYDECLSLLENIFSRDSQNLEARMLQVKAWLRKNETKKAVEKIEDLARAHPNVPQINYELAQAYVQTKSLGQAAIALNQAIAAKPDYVEAWLLLGEVDLQTGSAGLAVSAMLDLLKKHPHLLPAEMLLIEAYLSSGRPAEAASVAREQIRFSPQSADAYYRLGLILNQQGQPDQARSTFEKVLELAPGNLMAINQLVDLDLGKKDFGSAMRRVEEELKKRPPPAVAYFMEGKVYAAEGKFEQAEAPLRQALELDPDSLGTYELLTSVFLATNKVPQAISQLQDLLSKNPKQIDALMRLAAIYETSGNFDKARATYEQALSVNPDFAAALNKLAFLNADKFNRLDKAYELADKARSLEPVNPAIAETLGWVLYKQHHYQEAVSLIREAAEKLPDNPEVQFRLGVASYMMDQPDAARVALSKAVATQTEFSDKEEAHRWLAFLEGDSGRAKQLSRNELESLLDGRPNDVVARGRLAALLESEGAIADAAAQYEAALNLNPQLLDVTLKLAQLYAGPLHNFSRAFELAKAARGLDRGDPRTARILGKIAYLTGNFSWAYDLLVESAHGRKQDSTIAYDLAWAAYSLGKVSEAQKAMENALQLGMDEEHSNEGKRFLTLIALDQNHERIAGSDTEIEKVLETDPTYVPALMARATLESQKGKSAKAMETYDKILRRFPDFAPAQKCLATLYMQKVQDPVAASRAYELAMKARATLPADPALARMLGELSYQKNKYDYALQLLQESAKAHSLDSQGLYYLGMCHFQMQQQAQSRTALERSLAAGLPEPLAAEAKRVLAGMEKRN